MLHVNGKSCGSKRVEVSGDWWVPLGRLPSHGGIDRLYPRAALWTLPDDVLLEIFDFYVAADNTPRFSGKEPQHKDAWHTLVHVCKRWRLVVFASPCRLNLQLLCTNKRPVRNALDFWPSLPLVIKSYRGLSRLQYTSNIIAALKQQNRVYEIDIDGMPQLFLKKIRAIKLEGPFPKLTSLRLRDPFCRNEVVLPDLFLSGPAPRLRELYLCGVTFPALEKLLMSTHDLVNLTLLDIPRSGYISPEAMVTYLSALPRLKSLTLHFRFPRFRPGGANRHPPPLTRVVLPALAVLWFRGDSEYVEDMVSRIDTPALKSTQILFFNQLLFNIPLLCHFIGRTETLKAPHLSHITFSYFGVQVKLFKRKGTGDYKALELGTLCRPSDWQLSSLAKVCSSALPSLLAPTLEHLAMYEDVSYPEWQDDVENTQWIELLQPFTSVRDLELSGKIARQVIPALGELTGERVTEVLPALQTITLPVSQPTGPTQDAIVQFIAAREHAGFPVTVHYREGQEWINGPFLTPG